MLLLEEEEQQQQRKKERNLPLYLFAIGIEGSGHHLWHSLLNGVLDCLWQSAPHYSGIKTIGAEGIQSERINRYHGVPFLTFEKLADSLYNEYRTNKNKEKEKCRSIFNSLDSFPFGLASKGHDSTIKDGYRGRALNHPDLINLQALDGIMFNIKYLILARNITDASISVFSRRFIDNVDELVRGKEMNLMYLEAALRSIPCHKIFYAYFEHVQNFPNSFIDPLISFLQLNEKQTTILKRNFEVFEEEHQKRRREPYTFPTSLCPGLTQNGCYSKLKRILNNFFVPRNIFWPTFSGNGYKLKKIKK